MATFDYDKIVDATYRGVGLGVLSGVSMRTLDIIEGKSKLKKFPKSKYYFKWKKIKY